MAGGRRWERGKEMGVREGGEVERKRAVESFPWFLADVLVPAFCVESGSFISSGMGDDVPAFQTLFLRFLPLDSIPAKFPCGSHVTGPKINCIPPRLAHVV
jgi:hypothetical protein